MAYEVRDIRLASLGRQKIEWVKMHMPLLGGLLKDFTRDRPFEGVKITLSIHMEAKTAYLCEVLAAGGAKVCATGSNVLSTQDDVAAALAAAGIEVFAYHNASMKEYRRHMEMALDHRPNIIIDDGGDLVTLIHDGRKDLGAEVWGGCEETTTGINRLKAMQNEGLLLFPMLAVNDARCKYLFDNRYGTGQSAWDSIMRNTNLLIAGKQVVVAGYGWCSKGIAMRAKALGARVIVTEIDPVSAVEAVLDGFLVMPMKKAAPLGDIFVSATGNAEVITVEHMMCMKEMAILANAGHFNVEIDMSSLEKEALQKKDMRKNVTGYLLPNGKWISVIGEGRLVNIAAADGHPAEVMDMSFAVQCLSALYIKDNQGRLKNQLIDVSADIDDKVARRLLSAWDLEIDEITEGQRRYMNSWNL